jgi:hypothetical protein
MSNLLLNPLLKSYFITIQGISLDGTSGSSILEQIQHGIRHIADADQNKNISDEDGLLDEFNLVKNKIKEMMNIIRI